MSDFPPPFYSVIRAIDRFSELTGKLISLSMLWLVASISYECFSRYLLNAPTVWVLESSYMTNGSAFMLGCAYALHKGAHIRTDFFYEKWSVRTKGMVDSISYLVFFFPSLILFLAASGNEAWYAWTINETSEQTPWRPILWPYKAVVPVTCVLLMLQGVSEVIKSVYAWRMGVVLEHKEKIEI